MEELIFRRAQDADMPQILAPQTKVFHGEQKIPSNDIAIFQQEGRNAGAP